jgi:hypothetical protein
MEPRKCRHCRRPKVNRPRGLCWTCYYRPGVSELYPSTDIRGRRGVGNFCGNAPLDPERSDALPGSEERIAVLARRAAAGLALFRPDEPFLCPRTNHDFSRPTAFYNKSGRKDPGDFPESLGVADFEFQSFPDDDCSRSPWLWRGRS